MEDREVRIAPEVLEYANRKTIPELYKELYAIGQIPRAFIFPSLSGFLNSRGWKLFTNIIIVVASVIGFRNDVTAVNFYYFTAGQSLGNAFVSSIMVIDYYFEAFGIASVPQWARFMGPEPEKDGRAQREAVMREAERLEDMSEERRERRQKEQQGDGEGKPEGPASTSDD